MDKFMASTATWIGITVIVVVVVLAISIVTAWPFMWIWNYAVCAAVTVAAPITYWQAFWLAVFFGGFVTARSPGSK